MIKKIIAICIIMIQCTLSFTSAFADQSEHVRLTEQKISNNKVVVTGTKAFERGEYIPLDIESYIISPSENMIIRESFVKPDGADLSFDIIYNPNKTYSVVQDAIVGQIALYSLDEFKNSQYYSDKSFKNIIHGKTVYVAIPSEENFFLDDLELLNKFTLARENLFDLIQPYKINVDNGKLRGQHTEYTFELPENFNLEVYNDTHNDDTNAIEKIDFVLKTDATNDKYFILFELFTYDKNDFENVTGIFKIGENENLVYGVKINRESDFITKKSEEYYENALEIISADNNQVLKDSLILPVSAAKALESIKEKQKSEVTEVVTEAKSTNKLYINGEETEIEYTLFDNNLYFPIRKTFELIGFKIGWDNTTQSITYTNEDIRGLLKVDSNEYVVNDTEIKLEKPVILKNSISYVPVEFFAGVLPLHYVIKDNGAVFLILE